MKTVNTKYGMFTESDHKPFRRRKIFEIAIFRRSSAVDAVTRCLPQSTPGLVPHVMSASSIPATFVVTPSRELTVRCLTEECLRYADAAILAR